MRIDIEILSENKTKKSADLSSSRPLLCIHKRNSSYVPNSREPNTGGCVCFFFSFFFFFIYLFFSSSFSFSPSSSYFFFLGVIYTYIFLHLATDRKRRRGALLKSKGGQSLRRERERKSGQYRARQFKMESSFS